MEKKKKITLILVILILAFLVIGGIVFLYCRSNKTTEENDTSNSKLNQLYEDLKSKGEYSFSTVLDSNNKMYYAKSTDKAYIDTIHKGTESKFIIRDGNSYLLMEDRNVYYTYNNNEVDLNKIELNLESIKDAEFTKGKEKMDNVSYEYEEYKILTDLTMQDTSNMTSREEIKTRFYFKDGNLAYIKTVIGEKQELLKVDISYNVDNSLFEIPSNYQEM